MAGFKTKKKQFTSWSNSRMGDYEQCPARASYKHLEKLPEPKSSPMLRGIEVARLEEAFFKGDIKTLPVWKGLDAVTYDKEGPVYKWVGKVAEAVKNGLAIHFKVAPLLKAAKKQKDLFVEENWGFDRDWNVVDYFDWNNCWLRIKVDFGWGSSGRVVHLRDNKTGKYSDYEIEKYMDQLRLYAAGGASKFPEAEEFHVQLIFTDLGMVYPDEPLVITRDEALKIQKQFTKRVQPMFNDTRFDPTPNRGCRWCHFRKDNGGPCKF